MDHVMKVWPTCQDEGVADDEERGVEQQGCAQSQKTDSNLEIVW